MAKRARIRLGGSAADPETPPRNPAKSGVLHSDKTVRRNGVPPKVQVLHVEEVSTVYGTVVGFPKKPRLRGKRADMLTWDVICTIGTSSAGEAVSTPLRDVWMTREGRRHRADGRFSTRVPMPRGVSLRSRVPGNRACTVLKQRREERSPPTVTGRGPAARCRSAAKSEVEWSGCPRR